MDEITFDELINARERNFNSIHDIYSLHERLFNKIPMKKQEVKYVNKYAEHNKKYLESIKVKKHKLINIDASFDQWLVPPIFANNITELNQRGGAIIGGLSNIPSNGNSASGVAPF